MMTIEKKVLLVDDEEDLAESIEHGLISEGYHVTRADSLGDGLAKIAQGSYAVGILDHDLAGTNSSGGIELVAAMQQTSPETSLYLVTAQADEKRDKIRNGLERALGRKEQVIGLNGAVQGIFGKPLDLGFLRREVSAGFERYKQLMEMPCEIVIVDDDAPVTRSIKLCTGKSERDYNYTIVPFNDPREASDYIGSRIAERTAAREGRGGAPIALVLSDTEMPPMGNGPDLIRYVNSLNDAYELDIQLRLMTGNMNKNKAEYDTLNEQLGFNVPVFEKPLDMKRILIDFRQAVGRCRVANYKLLN